LLHFIVKRIYGFIYGKGAGMRKNLDEMSNDELAAELKRLNEELDDLEETASFHFSHTSAHIGGGAVAEHEEELKKLREKIVLVEGLLNR
jgi:hypothetical protein